MTKSAGGDPRGSDPRYSYSYSQLAAIVAGAQAGDPVCRVRLAELPAGERRLAKHVFKAFGGDVVIKSAKKSKKVKAEKPAEPDERRVMLAAMLAAELHSDDPVVREAAWKAVYGDG